MVQARSLLVAIALTVTVPPALAVDVPTCSEVRSVAQDYSWPQIRAMMKRHKLNAEQRAAIEACLSDKKK